MDSCPLTGDPAQMPEPERRSFAPRAAPWDGHAYAAVAIHSQQIPPGAWVTHEIELDVEIRCMRVEGSRRCEKRDGIHVIAEWKAQLHGDRISDQW